MKRDEVIPTIIEIENCTKERLEKPGFDPANFHRKRELIARFTKLAEWKEEAIPLLRAYAQLLWFNGQLNENAKVCALLGEKSALEHEQEDLPKEVSDA